MNMKVTKRDLYITIPFLLLLIIGVYGVYYLPYISGDQSFGFVKRYLLIPLIVFSLAYAYFSTFGYKQLIAVPVWKNLVVFVVMFPMISLVNCLSFQGSVIIINKEFGAQNNYLLSGEIVKVDYPIPKKWGNKYCVFIKREIENDTIEMDVPTNNYILGQKFKKEMKIGQFGFIYAER
ncbi:hypothetical protein CLU81_2243 [Flavobacterium sp. 9]|uniref:hypothetical protein n=1 Tax=Flavobacterium sp. 9 TaxID=2035198 RepID=UPI000C4577B1|nr:hypothetical protein [Flavobacterium sp. 9]PIF31737.1 hypothetical protein CLU81_2243 [Flavobacterium sp. 9]